MNIVATNFGSMGITAAIYLILLFIAQWLSLQLLKFRYAGPEGMNDFLSRYPRSKRLNFEDDTSVSLAEIQGRDAYGWGIMVMGMISIHGFRESICSSGPIWFLAIASLFAPAVHGTFRASSYFAAACFSELGISLFTETEKIKNGNQAIDLTLHRSHFGCLLLRSWHPMCQLLRAGHRGRSRIK